MRNAREDGDLLGIAEVARSSGLASSALRYYEREGLIRSAGREGGRRLYESSVLTRLAVIGLLQEIGFSIADIANVMRARSSQTAWLRIAEAKLKEIDAHLERVEAAKRLLSAALECGCPNIDTCEIVSSRRSPHHRAITTLGFGPPQAK